MVDDDSPSPGRRLNAKAIADRIGVSRSTVSRAFDPGSRISPQKRRQILRLANELGYRPTTAGRLAMRESPSLIAIVVRDITNPVRATLMTRLIRDLERRRILPLVFQVPDATAARTKAEAILGYLPKVLVTAGFMPPSSLITLCSQRGIPVLVVNRGRVQGLAASYVTSDHFNGGLIAGQELLRLGAQRIGLVLGYGATAGEERVRGFLAALDNAGAAVSAAFEGDHSYNSGVQAAYAMLANAKTPDAVFCSNDMMALGFLDTARDVFGNRVPEDIQIIGYDDIEMANWGAYRLTTVAQDMEAVIRASVRGISIILEHPERAINRVVPVRLVSRRTTRTSPPRSPTALRTVPDAP